MSTPIEDLTSLPDAKLFERVYSARTSLACLRSLPKSGYSLSRDSRLALHALRISLPLLEAEVTRRGLTLPHWVVEVQTLAP